MSLVSPVIEDFIRPYYSDDDKKRILELLDQSDKLENQAHDLGDGSDLYDQIQKLQDSELEIGESWNERYKRIDRLTSDYTELADKIRDIYKQIRVLDYEIDSIRLKAYANYTKDKKDSEILQDCLDLIDLFTVDGRPDPTINEDTQKIELPVFDKIGFNRFLDGEIPDDLKAPSRPSHILQFSYTIGQGTVNWYLDYFNEIKDNGSLFKIMKAIYDRTLAVFPDGFTDQDKQSEYCIFDDQFFKTLDAWNKKQADKKARQEYELDILANYRPDIKRHILPSNPKITSTMFALGTIGTEPHQMTIDDYLKENDKANDLITFRGLDDDGLQFVFNKTVAKNDSVVISFKNLENARGGGTAPSIVFGMVLEKMTSLGYYKGSNINTAVTISVKELIDDGSYANRSSGKRALIQAEKTFSELKVNFYNKKKGMDVDVSWFSSIGWKDKSTLLLQPNRDINWKLVGSHFAVYPIYIYKLKTHAYKLAYYIFTQARINKAPNEDGDIIFKLSLVNIARELGLPTVESIKNFKYKQNILDKIVTAMKEIDDADQESYGKDHRLVYLKLDHKKDLSPKEIIETANLVVTIKKGHNVTESYQMIRDRKTDIIESKRRKKEKAKRQAREKTDQT